MQRFVNQRSVWWATTASTLLIRPLHRVVKRDGESNFLLDLIKQLTSPAAIGGCAYSSVPVAGQLRPCKKLSTESALTKHGARLYALQALPIGCVRFG